jgi:hypothetical protein
MAPVSSMPELPSTCVRDRSRSLQLDIANIKPGDPDEPLLRNRSRLPSLEPLEYIRGLAIAGPSTLREDRLLQRQTRQSFIRDSVEHIYGEITEPNFLPPLLFPTVVNVGKAYIKLPPISTAEINKQRHE